jgi:hypothetical protein
MMDKIEYKKALIEVGKHILSNLQLKDPTGHGFDPERAANIAYTTADEFLKRVEGGYPTP